MTFELVWRQRTVTAAQTPRTFLDFVLGGESLYERHAGDLISCLGWLQPQAEAQAVRQLLGGAPPDADGRVAVQICPECADRECGLLTVILRHDGDDLLWSEPASSWFDSAETRGWVHETRDFVAWPELRFDAAEYRRVLSGVLTRVAGGAAGEKFA